MNPFGPSVIVTFMDYVGREDISSQDFWNQSAPIPNVNEVVYLDDVVEGRVNYQILERTFGYLVDRSGAYPAQRVEVNLFVKRVK